MVKVNLGTKRENNTSQRIFPIGLSVFRDEPSLRPVDALERQGTVAWTTTVETCRALCSRPSPALPVQQVTGVRLTTLSYSNTIKQLKHWYSAQCFPDTH